MGGRPAGVERLAEQGRASVGQVPLAPVCQLPVSAGSVEDMDADGGKSLIDLIGRERAEELMAKATREAAEATEAAGLPHAGIDPDGRVYREYPDGRREYLDEDPATR